jgi:hypothetical protein
MKRYQERNENSVPNKTDEHKSWTNHLDRITDEKTPKQILQYKPKGRD